MKANSDERSRDDAGPREALTDAASASVAKREMNLNSDQPAGSRGRVLVLQLARTICRPDSVAAHSCGDRSRRRDDVQQLTLRRQVVARLAARASERRRLHVASSTCLFARHASRQVNRRHRLHPLVTHAAVTSSSGGTRKRTRCHASWPTTAGETTAPANRVSALTAGGPIRHYCCI